ncbi:MAG: type VI secretion system tip protein VgrG [Planctomycetia bacterium]|nr:type VI secretion system tip protein VgrG [Planctomycetia bacterium]
MADTTSAAVSRHGRLDGVTVSTVLGDGFFTLTALEYREELGEPFDLTVELRCADPDVQGTKLVGQAFTVSLPLPNGQTRYIHAIMKSFARIAGGVRDARYRAVGISWYSMLDLAETSRIFTNVNVRDLMNEVFANFSFAAYDLKGFEPKTTWATRTQYRESFFNFLQRSTQQEGVYHFWTHAASRHTLNFCDNLANHTPFPGYAGIPFKAVGQGLLTEEHVHEWNVETTLQPSTMVLRDYNYTDPTMNLEKTAGAMRPLGPSTLEVFDYPGLFDTTADAERYAKIRMEERECRQQVYRGRAQCLGLSAGFTFALTGHPAAGENRTYLTTSLTLSLGSDPAAGGSRGGKATVDGHWYDCAFTAIPWEVQYRSRFSARIPQVLGLQPAFVYAPEGQDPQIPYTDSLGRIQVLFPWSRNSVQTAWVRKVQVAAGNGWGHMHCPRPGDEVLVAFEHGEVDRPVIVGCLFNGSTATPLPLPAAAHIHVFKDQGGNVLSLNPQADGQTILVYSPVENSWIVVGAGTPNPS